MQAKKIIVPILVIIIMSITLYNWGISNQITTQKDFDFFYNANIHGKVSDVSFHKVDYFKIEGCDTPFEFLSLPVPLGDNLFIDMAKKGDSIIKPSKSDTLILVKKGKKYKYTFEK